MGYTWTDGEVITAEKLNQTGGLSIYETSDFFKDEDTISGVVIEDISKDWPYVLKILFAGEYMIFHLCGEQSIDGLNSAIYSSGSYTMNITVGMGINFSIGSTPKAYSYNGTDYVIHDIPK